MRLVLYGYVKMNLLPLHCEMITRCSGFYFAKKSKSVKSYRIKFIMETEVSEMIAEMRINGKPTEPKIIKETENSLSCKGTMMTATILSTTNYFRLPNDIFNLHLSAGEIAVYAFILQMENRRTYTCFPSYKTIGRALKMSKNTIAKYVHSLADKRLIELEQTSFTDKSGKKRNGNLQYKVLPINVAVQEFYERQLANSGVK